MLFRAELEPATIQFLGRSIEMTAGRRRSTTRGRDSAVHIDDRLAPRWFTASVGALVIVRRRLQRRNAFWRDATQTLLIAANCRHLRDNAGTACRARLKGFADAGSVDGMDGLSGKAKLHQHLRRARQAVLYQMLCRALSKRKQANDVAFPPSFGGCRVSQRTTPIYVIALLRVNAMFSAAGHHRRFCDSASNCDRRSCCPRRSRTNVCVPLAAVTLAPTVRGQRRLRPVSGRRPL